MEEGNAGRVRYTTDWRPLVIVVLLLGVATLVVQGYLNWAELCSWVAVLWHSGDLIGLSFLVLPVVLAGVLAWWFWCKMWPALTPRLLTVAEIEAKGAVRAAKREAEARVAAIREAEKQVRRMEIETEAHLAAARATEEEEWRLEQEPMQRQTVNQCALTEPQETTDIASPDLAPCETRDCPFCSEQILRSAIKCKHCGEFLDGRSSHTTPPQQHGQMCPHCGAHGVGKIRGLQGGGEAILGIILFFMFLIPGIIYYVTMESIPYCSSCGRRVFGL